ncbi:MAG: DUF4863 family protein [Planctomycetes bacterium]|nr:DUF4863 family protein [Planctomycetota bacterium]
MSDLKSLLEPVSRLVTTLDLSHTAAAEAALAAAFPEDGDCVRGIEANARSGVENGTVCHRGEDRMRFSRIVKPEADVTNCSIDAVYMTDAKGPRHSHTKGEVCLCFPDDDAATFEGRRATWMVLPPGSTHEPTVAGGSMLILYWWPDGAVAWE